MRPADCAARGLAGKRIVVTRPSAQAAGLAGAIERAGGTALIFPAIEIRDVEDLRPLFAILDRLEDFDMAVFISPNAVHRAFDLVRARHAAGWPHNLRVAAIGRGSRRELERQGIEQVVAPLVDADSEALLALPELEVLAGRRVVIFRGQGGRELLGDALAARGAVVEYAECYRRTRPQTDCGPLLAEWARNAIDAVTVSSGEGLANFCDMIGASGRQWLKRTPLFVPHERVAGQAVGLGAGRVRVAGPGDAEVVAALVAYFRDAK
jgi:uroporphyrinogen-III synthase